MTQGRGPAPKQMPGAFFWGVHSGTSYFMPPILQLRMWGREDPGSRLTVPQRPQRGTR